MLDFKNFNFYFMQPGFSKQRLEIFEKQINKFNGKISHQIDVNTTHVILNSEAKQERIWWKKWSLLNSELQQKLVLLSSNWISACLKTKQVQPTEKFIIALQPDNSNDETAAVVNKEPEGNDVTPAAKRLKVDESTSNLNVKNMNHISSTQTSIAQSQLFTSKNDDSDYESSGDEDGDVKMTSHDKDEAIRRLLGYDPKEMPKGNWICTQSSKVKKQESELDRNAIICSKLEQMADNYEATGDKWRVYAYRKAVNAVKSYKQPITTYEQACSIPGVGKKLGEKVWEIVEKGSFSKLDNVVNSEKMQVLNLFMNIHGVGAKTAETWFAMGHRTLDDIRQKVTLTSAQKTGVELYDDLVLRMPREEAAQIECYVRNKVHEIDTNALCEVCGSFRRGKPTCGDLDLLITTPDGISQSKIMAPLLGELHKTGFLTHDLVSVVPDKLVGMRKYMGVCKLEGFERHRRIDIICVPFSEYPCAVVYFTGSAYFNRSLRLLAQRRQMSLNEHHLKRNVFRTKGQKATPGDVIPVKSEQELFQIMGVPFRPPVERDW